MITGFIQENGGNATENVVNANQATIFPMGSIHFQQNTGCEPLTFIAAFNHEDPGTSQIAQASILSNPRIS